MYRLYDYDKHVTLVVSDSEADIFNVLCNYMENVVGQRYLIVWDAEETKAPEWVSIRSVRDFYDYALDYNRRLKEQSCKELKKEIVKRGIKC